MSTTLKRHYNLMHTNGHAQTVKMCSEGKKILVKEMSFPDSSSINVKSLNFRESLQFSPWKSKQHKGQTRRLEMPKMYCCC